MGIKLLLWTINSIVYGAFFALIVKILGFTGYHAGYVVGVFVMMFYYVGLIFIRYKLTNK